MPLDAAPPTVKTARAAAVDRLTLQTAQVLTPLLAPGARLCVGLSGGIDSVVLLHVVVALAPRYQWQVSALHVNHQLHPDAPAWARFCRALCRARAVPLRVVKVTVPRGDSIEAAARARLPRGHLRQPDPHRGRHLGRRSASLSGLVPRRGRFLLGRDVQSDPGIVGDLGALTSDN